MPSEDLDDHPDAARRLMLLAGPAALLLASGAQAADSRSVAVYKTRYCGCCWKWIAAMKAAGHKVRAFEIDSLDEIRRTFGVPFNLSSCHTSIVSGYVIEGPAPPNQVARLLARRPVALGLIAGGRRIGGPVLVGSSVDDVPTLLLLDRTGRTKAFT